MNRFTLLIFLFFANQVIAKDLVNNGRLTILFTNDIHSNFNGVKVLNKTTNNYDTLGSFSKLATQIKIEREKAGRINTILVDAGDMSMGSLYQLLYRDYAPELTMLSLMGYDAVTIGNHDFDFGIEAYVKMLASAERESSKNNFILPQFLIANLNPYKDKALSKAFIGIGRKDYTILIKGGLKIAIMGLLGKEAFYDAPNAKHLLFEDPIAAARRMVKEIKNENVDYIIALSHGGTISSGGISPDQKLASSIPDIDVIISGHAHDRISTPIVQGKTLIVSSGFQARDLGKLVFDKSGLVEYKLIPINQSIRSDSLVQSFLNFYSDKLTEAVMIKEGVRPNDTITSLDSDFALEELSPNISRLGYVIADSYSESAVNARPNLNNRAVIGIVPAGTIRANLLKGAVSYHDVFNVLSLGEGENNSPGYPLLLAYVYGYELRDICELNASVSASLPDAKLYLSNIKYTYVSYRLPFTRVTDIEVSNGKGEYSKLVDSKLYPIVAGMYSAKMLGLVKRTSFGLLSVIPRDSLGKELKDYNSSIIYNNMGYQEKEWKSLASYLKKMTITDFSSRVKKISTFDTMYLFIYPNMVLIISYIIGVLIIVLGLFYIKRVVSR